MLELKTAHLRLLMLDTFDQLVLSEDPADKPTEFTDVDTSQTPNWLVRPDVLRSIFARHDELKRTIYDLMLKTPRVPPTLEVFLGCVSCKFIMMFKSLIAVYNFFHVPDMNDPGARYSTILDHTCGDDLDLIVASFDAFLASPKISSKECRFVLEGIDETMKAIFDLLASAADDEVRKSGVDKLRATYRVFRKRHPTNGSPSTDKLLDAFGAVADFFADREGLWLRDRPAPTLKKPIADVKVGPRIPNKLVAIEFECSVNTIVNWNKRLGRPFDYDGPYPDTPEGKERLRKDGELYRLNKHNDNVLLKRKPEDLSVLPIRYTQFEYGVSIYGTGNVKAINTPWKKPHPNKPCQG